MKNLPYVIFILVMSPLLPQPDLKAATREVQQACKLTTAAMALKIKSSTTAILTQADNEPCPKTCIDLLNTHMGTLDKEFATHAVGNKRLITALWNAFTDIHNLIADRQKAVQIDWSQERSLPNTTTQSQRYDENTLVFDENFIVSEIKEADKDLAEAIRLFTINETKKALRFETKGTNTLYSVWYLATFLNKEQSTDKTTKALCAEALEIISERTNTYSKTMPSQTIRTSNVRCSPAQMRTNKLHEEVLAAQDLIFSLLMKKDKKAADAAIDRSVDELKGLLRMSHRLLGSPSEHKALRETIRASIDRIQAMKK